MSETGFWLIRHAVVDENARAMLYGVMDVPLCDAAASVSSSSASDAGAIKRSASP